MDHIKAVQSTGMKIRRQQEASCKRLCPGERLAEPRRERATGTIRRGTEVWPSSEPYGVYFMNMLRDVEKGRQSPSLKILFKPNQKFDMQFW